MKLKKRITALLIAGAMVCSTLPVNVLAVENSNQHISGLCEHHTEHNADCGYSEGKPGTPCNHEHTEDCYTLVTECVHEHTEDCYPAEGVSDNTATPSEPDKAEPTECAHECNEESGCITEALNCQHEHDSDCGYAEAVPGTPCTFVCEECNAETGEQEDKCICNALCTEDAVNTDCPVCGGEDADLSVCKGEPEQEKAECICIALCIEGVVNTNCPICGALGADLTQCVGKKADEQVKAVQEQINTLPTADELAAMSKEEQDAVYEKLQAAYEAYNALTDEQKAEVIGAEIFDSLFEVFDSMVNTLEETGDFIVEGGTLGTDYSYADGVLTIANDGTFTISSDGNDTTDRIEVADGINADITIRDLYIDTEAGNAILLGANSTLNLTLSGDNILKPGQKKAGISVPAGSKLTISGDGCLDVTGGRGGSDEAGGAAIGADVRGSIGTIIITSGIINAHAHESNGGGSGIGAGGWNDPSDGAVSILGGHVIVSGKGGEGSFRIGDSSKIQISGAIVEVQDDKLNNATKSDCLIWVNDTGNVYGTFTIDSDFTLETGKTLLIPEGTEIHIDNIMLTNNGIIYNLGTISGTGTIDNTGGIIYNTGKMPEVSGGTVEKLPEGTQIINTGSITIGDTCNGECEHYIFGIGEVTDNTVKVTGGSHNIIIEDVNISTGDCAFSIENGATVNLTLRGENTLRSGNVYAGLQVPKDAELVITEESAGSSLTATGVASDSFNAICSAGIGGGYDGQSGDITINGGTITASGGSAGIGGYGCGNITIRNAQVNCTGAAYYSSALGCRSDTADRNCGNIVIENSIVNARGGHKGSGIVAGRNGYAGTVVIRGSEVSVIVGESDWKGGAIGGPKSDITIEDSYVYAYAGNFTALGGENAKVTVNSGYVETGGNGYGLRGTLAMSSPGNPIIVSYIKDEQDRSAWSGLVIELRKGEIYGGAKVTLDQDLELKDGFTLSIPEGSKLTIGEDVTLTNRGAITVGGTLDYTEGYINNFGTITKTGNGVIIPDDIAWNHKQTALTLWVEDCDVTWSEDGYQRTYTYYGAKPGATVTLKATVQEAASANSLMTFAVAQKEITFYATDSRNNKRELGRKTVIAPNQAVELSVTLDADDWNVGFYTITAEYTGGNENLLPVTTVGNEYLVVQGQHEPPTDLQWGEYDTSTKKVTISWTDSVSGAYYNKAAVYRIENNGTRTEIGNSYTWSGVQVTLNDPGNYIFVVEATNVWDGDGSHTSMISAQAESAVLHIHGWSDDWVSSGTHHWHPCSVVDCTVTQDSQRPGYEAHTNPGDDGDCITAVKCTVCEYEFKAAQDSHSYGNWNNNHNKTHTGSCGNQGCTQQTMENCDRSGADGVCSKCGYKWIVISAQPGEQAVDMGKPAEFSVAATGDDPTSTYQWEYSTDNGASWTSLSGATGSTYTVETAKLNMDGYLYRCTVSNSGDSVTSETAKLTVQEVKELQPDIKIDFEGEMLTGFDLNGSYTIDNEGAAPTNGTLAVGNYMGKTISIVKKGDGINSNDSPAQSLLIPQRDTSPNVSVDFAVETLTTAPTMHYMITASGHSGQKWETCVEDMDVAAFGWDGSAEITVKFRTAATSSNFASLETVVTIPARLEAPDTLQGKNETYENDKDGEINGVSSAMEYRLSTVAEWTPCTGERVTDLAPGEYLVRYKATDSAFASRSATVEIKTGQQRTYTLNVTAPAFEPVSYGNTQPEAKAITINSTGNSDSTISGVTVNGEAFVIGGFGSSVTAGGSIDTWTIRPAAGLDAGTYTATITVSYTGNAKATVQVSFTVNQAEQAAPDKGPELESRDRNSITLKAVPDNGNGAKAEYSKDGGTSWQTSPVFSDLSSGTKYGFIVRYGVTADGNYTASPASPTAEYSTQSSGGGSSSSDSTIIDRPDKDNPTTPTTAETKSVKADSKGNVVITKSIVDDAVSTAQADAKKNSNTANGIAVVVPVEISETLDGIQITLKADALDKLVSSGVKRFTIDTDSMTDFGFTLDTLKKFNQQTSGDIVLKVKKTTVSSAEAKAAIGNRPAYDISLWEVKNGKETKRTDMTGVKISVAIPYTLAKNEQTGNLYAVYVDGSGKVQWITKSSYDLDQRAVIFEAEHFSIYGVGYKNPAPNFTDIRGHWAKEHILFTVSRGLFSGTSSTTFSPDTTLTRGMFVTALGRLAGINPADYQTGTFTDVKADAYYAPYVNWAASKGIVSGTTSTTFAPDSQISREQMAVIMKNYADKMGYSIPKTLEAVTFADNTKISSWAKEAVKAMQQAGILSGKSNNQFDPKGNATRAEAATVLHRFVEVIIDPQTANGWVQNDSGEWNYYKNGEPVKGWLSNDQKWYWLDKTSGKMFSGGWKQIEGKWYYFYSDGSMAVSTKVDGYEVGADGARKK